MIYSTRTKCEKYEHVELILRQKFQSIFITFTKLILNKNIYQWKNKKTP